MISFIVNFLFSATILRRLFWCTWKILAEEEKKINLQVLKSSAISIKCLEFVKIIWKFEIYEKICYCQVEKVIIFITKIA